MKRPVYNTIATYGTIKWFITPHGYYIESDTFCDYYPLKAFEDARRAYNDLVPECEAIPFF